MLQNFNGVAKKTKRSWMYMTENVVGFVINTYFFGSS